jgi:hypothetical protein
MWVPEHLKPEDDHVREVYAHFGLAVYAAQVLEHDLVNLAIVAAAREGHITSHQHAGALWDELFGLTMGKQIRRALDVAQVPESLVTRLADALRLRNHLAHDFFRERAELMVTTEGRNEMLEELERARDELGRIDNDLGEVTMRYLETVGVPRDAIAAEFKRMKQAAMARRDGPEIRTDYP